MIESRRRRDLIGGLVFCAVGLFFVAGAFGMNWGTAQRMGPGYLPLVLGILLIGLSLVSLFQAGPPEVTEETIAWRPLIACAAAIVAFGLGLRWLGFIPAVVLAVVLASLGDRTARPVVTIALAVFLAVSAWAIFRLGLNLPMPAFRGLLQWTP
ncbi:tripartite tricarboxylate transporter TctB family protein [Faunimonas sp. B44]|uniref:tripartite tricarboxylate transporter TctB family protein n=1 Tax=Faunimonas sp. B44 TaxID=3461493 RepID=UPI0040449C60